MNITLALKKVVLKQIICTRLINRLIRVCSPLLRLIVPGRLISRIPIIGVIAVVTPRGEQIDLQNDGDDSIASSLYWLGLKGFEDESVSPFCSLARYTSVILDVGANTGIYTLLTAKTNSSARVYAFEPVPEIFRYLERNIALNNLTNVRAFRWAVTDFDGEITLLIPTDFANFPTSASTKADFQPHCRGITVPARTLDSFASQECLLSVDLIKVDTEATEHLVLEGARELLDRCRPIILCEVLPAADISRLEGVLRPRGYHYFWMSKSGLIPMTTISADDFCLERNYLFVPSERMADLPAFLSG